MISSSTGIFIYTLIITSPSISRRVVNPDLDERTPGRWQAAAAAAFAFLDLVLSCSANAGFELIHIPSTNGEVPAILVHAVGEGLKVARAGTLGLSCVARSVEGI